jgi:hypothetical protein
MHGRLFDLALVAPDPLRPAMLAGPPEVDAHQGAAHSACVLFGSYGCHPRFQSRRCSSAGCVLSAARNELESTGGIAREVHVRKIPPRAEGTPEPPPTAPRHRIVRATAMPRAASVCSSATGGACVCERSHLWRRSTRAVRQAACLSCRATTTSFTARQRWTGQRCQLRVCRA